MLTAATGLYLALVAGLLYIGQTKAMLRRYTVAKTAASIGFLLVAFAAYFAHGQRDPVFFRTLLPCFVLCLTGDVFLGLANSHGKFFSRFFLAGVGAFLAAHIGFCIVFTVLLPGPYRFVLWEYAVPAVLVGFTAVLTRSHRFEMRRMKAPVLLYAGFVGLMCAKGIYFSIVTDTLRGVFIATGSVLFLLSDCIILFLYFYYKPRKILRFFNLFFYYAGMLALALAC